MMIEIHIGWFAVYGAFSLMVGQCIEAWQWRKRLKAESIEENKQSD